MGILFKKIFLSIATEENENLKKDKIINLKKLFPKELMIIKKLEKLMFKMDKEDFISFINVIYDKQQRMIDYDTIRKTEAEYSIKGKVKKLYINRFK